MRNVRRAHRVRRWAEELGMVFHLCIHCGEATLGASRIRHPACSGCRGGSRP